MSCNRFDCNRSEHTRKICSMHTNMPRLDLIVVRCSIDVTGQTKREVEMKLFIECMTR